MANLEVNARNRLTTPFDVHETLRDLVAPAEFMRDETIKRRMQELRKSKIKVVIQLYNMLFYRI